MLRSRRNVGKHKLNCPYGCCPSVPKKLQVRQIKRWENRQWKKEVRKWD